MDLIPIQYNADDMFSPLSTIAAGYGYPQGKDLWQSTKTFRKSMLWQKRFND